MIFFSACIQENESKQKEINRKQLKESLLKANKELIKTEDQLIRDYIERYQWEMKETGTGLRYWIYKNGKGKIATLNQVATINYQLSLLNGIICYSSEEKGPKKFKIGQGGIESGLEEGILLLRKGDRAKFIIPSHLAYGLIGDKNKIPPKATLVYDIELIELN
jgi:FKBP-type peptidyl-prolyl cis-trans isomerase